MCNKGYGKDVRMTYLYVGIAGFIGSVLRFAISALLSSINPTVLPLATITVNLIGCFCLPLLTFYIFKKYPLLPIYKTAINTGLVGSFTTFSAISLETIILFEECHFLLGLSYIFISFAGGISFSRLGLFVAEKKENL